MNLQGAAPSPSGVRKTFLTPGYGPLTEQLLRVAAVSLDRKDRGVLGVAAAGADTSTVARTDAALLI